LRVFNHVAGYWLLVATYQLEEPEIFGNAVLKKIDEATKACAVKIFHSLEPIEVEE